ncbi:MAG: acetylglutamate kinase [Bacteroidales bacterium]|nr:acetylglutamate kinase [Bacteroidales bacterium]
MNNNQEHKVLVVKYGGNAMLDDQITSGILEKLANMARKGYRVVVVHGGGPFIEDNLKMAGIESEFVGGHRKTTEEAMKYIEMALKGHVNSKLVRMLNGKGLKAVGLSGKDGNMVRVTRRYHRDEQGAKVDIGFVGDIERIDGSLLNLLMAHGYVPVVSTIASGEEGDDYNVNADMFAGHLAGALQADHFIMLTDVDGLMGDINDPGSLIKSLRLDEIEKLKGSTIQGGMIPKTRACEIALEQGAASAVITNGTRPDALQQSILNPENARATRFVR